MNQKSHTFPGNCLLPHQKIRWLLRAFTITEVGISKSDIKAVCTNYYIIKHFTKCIFRLYQSLEEYSRLQLSSIDSIFGIMLITIVFKTKTKKKHSKIKVMLRHLYFINAFTLIILCINWAVKLLTFFNVFTVVLRF